MGETSTKTSPHVRNLERAEARVRRAHAAYQAALDVRDAAVRAAIQDPDEGQRLTRYRVGKVLGLADNAVRHMLTSAPRQPKASS